jgi:DNA helicase-2/ATP-dependent DNA helicase PcrA
VNQSDLLQGLNQQQIAAITAPLAPTLVIAGPGSGKTAVLTRRVAYLVSQLGVPPHQIMAVTFTNKAAREMLERIEVLLGANLHGLTIGTFHAICARILRREATHVGISPSFTIYDTEDQLNVMRMALSEFGLDEDRSTPRKFLNAISNAKNELIAPEAYPQGNYQDRQIAQAYERYQALLRAANALDFDDLLMYCVMLFRDHTDVRRDYQARYKHILVDEFQDTNTAQYQLVRLLAGAEGSLFCVGDPDQSIYRFRGADYRNLAYFQRDYPNAKVILLEQNYRSHQIILDAAMAIIDKNTDRVRKQLYSARREGAKIMLKQLSDDEDEAQYVVWTIRELVRQGRYTYRDCAVMFRTNAQSRALEETFIRANVPYKLIGGVRFYSRREIKDLLAYLRVIQNPSDDVSLRRIINTPPRGIGKTTLAKLEEWALSRNQSLSDALSALRSGQPSPFSGKALSTLEDFAAMLEVWRNLRDTMPVGVLLRDVLDQTAYLQYINDGTPEGLERAENVRELALVAESQGNKPLALYLEEIALVSDVDTYDESADSVVLLTLHAAKGLEFPVVFIVGMEEGLLPHAQSLEDEEELAEERRLMYVGLTRAKDQVYLTWTVRRMGYGGGLGERVQVSRFLEDIPPQLTVGSPVPKRGASALIAHTERDRALPPRPVWRLPMSPQSETQSRERPPRSANISTSSLYRSGQRVYHEKLGEGVIIASRFVDGDEELDIRFEKHGLKRLFASIAPLRMLDDD